MNQLRQIFTFLGRWLLYLAMASGNAGAWAQIIIGQSTGLTGQVASGVAENLVGARLYFDMVNRQGGVAGRKIELRTLDDGFDPERAAANALLLAQDPKVIALFLSRGTPHSLAMVPILRQFKIPLVAPSSGAMSLRAPSDPWIFNVRSPYQLEAQAAIHHLLTVGSRRVALLYPDDSFGRDALEGARQELSKSGLSPLIELGFPRDQPDQKAFLLKVAALQPEGVLFIGSEQAVATGIQFLRSAGYGRTVITLSNNASAGFIRSLGNMQTGVIVTQVFPSDHAITYPIVAELQQAARGGNAGPLTPSMMEGYVAAKVLVEGLRRAAPDFSRARLTKALESLGTFDLGGIELQYAPGDHTGLHFVDLAIISADGHFRR
ncbi:MAG: ABC transporter substrate-binding protein [Curvibacter sp.]|nr:ABC transporter substrate-binding protein [Curvibacter sp.]